MGKREIGQLSLFDFVVLLLIADVAVTGIESTDIPFYIYLIGIVLLGVIQKLLAIVSLRVPKLRNILDGSDSVIIFEGKINLKEMKKQSYNIDDLIVHLRLKNVRSISEVRYAILEPNGEISLFKFSDFKGSSDTQTSASSMSKTINPITNNKSGEMINSSKSSNNNNEIYPFPLIISGSVNKTNLNLIKKDMTWLNKELHKQGYSSEKDVYFANYENGNLFIVQTCDF